MTSLLNTAVPTRASDRGTYTYVAVYSAVLYTVLLIAPVVAGKLIQQFGLTPVQLGGLFSLELGAFSLATVPAYLWLRRMNLRTASYLFTAVVIAGNVLSGFVDSFPVLVAVRFVTSLAVREQHGRDESPFDVPPPEAVVFCESTEDVASVVAAAAAHRVPVIPYGAGSSLEIRVAGAAAAIIQHQAHDILARVNLFLGSDAVQKLRIVQGPLRAPDAGAPPPRRRAVPLDAAQEAKLAESLADAPEGPLKEALAKLGRGVLRRQG